MRNLRTLTLATITLLAFAAAASAQQWGSLTGRFVLEGKAPAPKPIPVDKDAAICGVHKLVYEAVVVDDKGGIANCIISLRTKDVAVAPMYAATADEKVVLDNKNCRFEPHVSIVRTTQNFTILNSDPIAHNTKIAAKLNPAFNEMLPNAGSQFTYKTPSEEGMPIEVGCSIHPWMNAWVMVRKDPYAAVSKPDGSFEIKDLPAGKELEFSLWEEKPGNLKDVTFKGGKADNRGRIKFTIKPGENSLGDIKVPASLF